MDTIKGILMRRDGLTEDEAIEMIRDARKQIRNGADPEDILHYEFGLEPDYIFELI